MSMQMVELLYDCKPNLDFSAITSRVNELIDSGAFQPEGDEEPTQLHLFHQKHQIEFKDGKIPAQTALFSANKAPVPEEYGDEVQQSWACPDAQQIVNDARHSLMLTEFMSQGLEPKERLHLFHGTLQACIEKTNPIGMSFKHSCQIVDPETYLNQCSYEPAQRAGSINIRFFNISNTGDGDSIMESRGLEEIGLHDLQCHYRRLDPNEVAANLMNLALYLVDNGPVIESGHTVAGTEEGSIWQAQFEESLLDPKREVLDLNPGSPYAAGGRQGS